jgi:hypothetical protein
MLRVGDAGRILGLEVPGNLVARLRRRADAAANVSDFNGQPAT